MTTYPTQPTGDNSIDLTNIFASNSTSKILMSTEEILEGYNNDGEAVTPLTSTPDGNKFNYFWYQVHNTLAWVVNYTKALFDNKLETSGGSMSGILSMGTYRISNLAEPTNNTDATTKQYVDTAVSGAMWLSEVKYLSYPNLPTLPSGMEVVNADGRALSKTTYSALYALIGTTYGGTEAGTTFNIPDLRGKYITGWNGSGSLDSGRTFGSDQKRENSKYTFKYDYTNRISRTIGVEYTADTDGLVFIFGLDSYSTSIIYIDGIAYNQNGAGTVGTVGGGTMPITAGQTYKFYNAYGATCYFIPKIQTTNSSQYTQTNLALYPVIRIK